jgi:hypothetical protein
MEEHNRIENQYLGFINTPSIFEDNGICGYENFILPRTKKLPTSLEGIPPTLMLGKRAEYFFSKTLEANKNVKIILENIQIQREKITLGELDFIIYDEHTQQYKHIELVYKFYLYDSQLGKDELLNWVGPNKNDSLIKKLQKLKEKQFPILHSIEGIELLNKLSIDVKNITQQLCFKAQLFVPYSLAGKSFSHINPSCIKGYWLSVNEFNAKEFGQHSFYLPEKRDWFVNPKECNIWSAYQAIQPIILQALDKKKSLLVWMKDSKGQTSSFFVVWW